MDLAATQSDVSRLQKHVEARIAATDLETDPFPHCYIQNIFPDDLYRSLVATLPPDSFYSNQAPPYETRLFLNLDETNAAMLDPLWQSVECWMNGQSFLDFMMAKFSAVLPTMARHRAPLLERHTDDGGVKVSCRTMLTRDSENFALGPHTDTAKKFLTAIFYLPTDEKYREFGTSLYRPKENGFTSWRSTHFPHSGFNLVKTMSNVPNSVFIFAKTDNSFHGVQPGNYPGGGRNMMMWVPEIGPSLKSWGERRVPVARFTGT